MDWKLGGLILLLAGCASTPDILSPDRAITLIRGNLMWREIGEAFTIYGPPEGQTKINGNTVYLWRHSRSIDYSRPQQAVTRGRVGDGSQHPYGQSVPYVEYSTVQSWETESYQCVLSLGVDSRDYINGVGLNGKMGACQDFVR